MDRPDACCRAGLGKHRNETDSSFADCAVPFELLTNQGNDERKNVADICAVRQLRELGVAWEIRTSRGGPA